MNCFGEVVCLLYKITLNSPIALGNSTFEARTSDGVEPSKLIRIVFLFIR